MSTARPANPSISQPGIPSVAEAMRQLDALRVTARESPERLGYSRSAFGNGWVDTDGNGCNQRDDVLLRDAVPGSVRVVGQGACDHDVVAGVWIDPYTGAHLGFDNLKDQVQAQAIQIDHVVPLAEAWVSGATYWSRDRRQSFANDLAELLAVDGPTNASKGSGDPAAWRPKKEFQCDYARRWIALKATWNLALDGSELRALTEMLAFCES
ncbi:MAG TPA: HNH endonuclease family protein [Propionicimonas sp.]|nr:HNH endonuclease family protein [Propionicimonas sp.]